MSNFLQLEYGTRGSNGDYLTDMVIVNLDNVLVIHVSTKRIVLPEEERYTLTGRGWEVLMKAIEPHQLTEEQRKYYRHVPTTN
jgi:hypothetical protein